MTSSTEGQLPISDFVYECFGVTIKNHAEEVKPYITGDAYLLFSNNKYKDDHESILESITEPYVNLSKWAHTSGGLCTLIMDTSEATTMLLSIYVTNQSGRFAAIIPEDTLRSFIVDNTGRTHD